MGDGAHGLAVFGGGGAAMTDLFGYALVGLVVVLAVGQVVGWATGWHREVGRLQEQAAARALAAQREKATAHWNEVNR